MNQSNPTCGLTEVLQPLLDDMLRVIGGTNCSHHNEVCRWRAQLQAISEAVTAQSEIPAAWHRPHIVTFDGVVRTDCPKDLQAELEGTVAWEVGTFSDGIQVTDKHGIMHHSRPLFPPLRFPIDADPATSPTGAKTDGVTGEPGSVMTLAQFAATRVAVPEGIATPTHLEYLHGDCEIGCCQGGYLLQTNNGIYRSDNLASLEAILYAWALQTIPESMFV